MSQMGMYQNMFGMNPNSMNLNADPSQGGNMPMGADMQGMMGNQFYPGMFQGMENQQQHSNGNNQQNN